MIPSKTRVGRHITHPNRITPQWRMKLRNNSIRESSWLLATKWDRLRLSSYWRDWCHWVTNLVDSNQCSWRLPYHYPAHSGYTGHDHRMKCDITEKTIKEKLKESAKTVGQYNGGFTAETRNWPDTIWTWLSRLSVCNPYDVAYLYTNSTCKI